MSAADSHRSVRPAAVTSIGAPRDERLAPPGTTYLPSTYNPHWLNTPGAHGLDQASILHYQPQPQPTRMAQPLSQTYPSNVPLSQTYPPAHHQSYAAQPAGATGYYRLPVGQMSAAPGAAQHQNHSQHTHEATKRVPIHAPGEPSGTLPYYLPDNLARPLGYALQASAVPTLGVCDVDRDLVTIRVTDESLRSSPRWRLELQDEQWGAPIDALVDSKSASFRLNDAASRSLKVRACKVSIDGSFGNFSEWKPITQHVPPTPEPASPLTAAAATAMAAVDKAEIERERVALEDEAHAVRHGGGPTDEPPTEAELSSDAAGAIAANAAAVDEKPFSISSSAVYEGGEGGNMFGALASQLGVAQLLESALGGQTTAKQLAEMELTQVEELLGAVNLGGLAQLVHDRAKEIA